MNRSIWTLVMRHQLLVKDGSAVVVVIAALATVAFAFDLTGSGSSEQKIDLNELLMLGVVFGAGVAWFGWRRILEQEKEILAKTEAERQAEFLAHHDHLTGLPNRRRLQQELQAALANDPADDETHALFLLDLNGFKRINDVHGHSRGDEILRLAADRIARYLPSSCLLARTGGDEFAVVARNRTVEDIGTIAERLVLGLSAPIRVGADEHLVGTGVGIALIPGDGREAEELMRKADVALYRAKAQNGSCVMRFEPDMDRETRERNLMQRALAAAVATKAIVPFYQPIVDLETGALRAFEALARWTHPTLGPIAPDRFIPLAEESGLISALSDDLLHAACIEAMTWPADIGLSFNVSPTMLRDRTLGLRILRILGSSGLSPHRLELEITETAIFGDFEVARESLQALREAGLRIVLDDFGTGATSLSHLQSFKFDGLKIDRRFVGLMLEEGESEAIVKAVLGLARGLGLSIVAEGIELAAQSAALQRYGCSTGQGFHFSHALPASETARYIAGRAEASRRSEEFASIRSA